MNYKLLGKLPLDTVNFFKEEILKRRSTEKERFIHFDTYLSDKFKEIFTDSQSLIIKSQKAVVADSGSGWKIHKDGYDDKGALNFVISCNKSDWIRFYKDDFIYQYCLMNNIPISLQKPKSPLVLWTRNVDISNYENVPFNQEIHSEAGDLYLINVDQWHSFKCIGNNPLIVIQTRFKGNPNFEYLCRELLENKFKDLS